MRSDGPGGHDGFDLFADVLPPPLLGIGNSEDTVGRAAMTPRTCTHSLMASALSPVWSYSHPSRSRMEAKHLSLLDAKQGGDKQT